MDWIVAILLPLIAGSVTLMALHAFGVLDGGRHGSRNR